MFGLFIIGVYYWFQTNKNRLEDTDLSEDLQYKVFERKYLKQLSKRLERLVGEKPSLDNFDFMKEKLGFISLYRFELFIFFNILLESFILRIVVRN
jgi:hypothetical protein